MKLRSLFASTLCGALLFSCSNKEEGTDVTGGDPVQVTIAVSTEGKTRAATRALATTAESTVASVEFYVFNSDGSNDGKNPYIQETGSVLEKNIVVNSGDNKKFVTVVNSNLGAVANYAALKAKLAELEFKATLGQTDHNARTETAGKFEMTGETIRNVAVNTTNTIVNITVDRVVSRVNAPIYKNGSNDTGVILNEEQVKDLWGDDAAGIDPDDISFVPLGYTVINGLSKSDAFYISGSNWGSWAPKGTYLNSSFTTAGYYTNTYAGKGQAIDWFLDETINGEHRVYLYENRPEWKVGSDGQEGWDAKTVNAIMLKGNLVVAGQSTLTKTRYWRVNLTSDDNYHIYRNSVYDVYIQNITSIGWETPEEGETNPPIIPPAGESSVQVRITVSDWTHKEYETNV